MSHQLPVYRQVPLQVQFGDSLSFDDELGVATFRVGVRRGAVDELEAPGVRRAVGAVIENH